MAEIALTRDDLGAGWVGLPARLMPALPDFPGKDRMPPWAGVIS